MGRTWAGRHDTYQRSDPSGSLSTTTVVACTVIAALIVLAVAGVVLYDLLFSPILPPVEPQPAPAEQIETAIPAHLRGPR